MKHRSQPQSSIIALVYPLKACLVAVALLPGAVGCETAETPDRPIFSQVDPASAQTRPLTPDEWVRRNFPKPADSAAGQPSPIAAQPQPTPQSTTTTLAAQPANTEPVPAAGTPPPGGGIAPPSGLTAQASPPAQPATSPPTLVSEANPPAAVAPSSGGGSLPPPELIAQASPPARLPAILPPTQVQPANPDAGRTASSGPQPSKPDRLVLREGDTVRVTFPGAPQLNTVAQIRRDGRITLPLIDEFKIAGMAPTEAEKELLKLYGPQLQVKEVSVAVDSSFFTVYVTGSVLRPGKIMSDRPISAMEAVVEAGIDYSKANLKKVRVIRQENGRSEYHIINLRESLLGKHAESFDLRPSDIIYVPERFTWF
jgi:polysaccharide export outer membrane protein